MNLHLKLLDSCLWHLGKILQDITRGPKARVTSHVSCYRFIALIRALASRCCHGLVAPTYSFVPDVTKKFYIFLFTSSS